MYDSHFRSSTVTYWMFSDRCELWLSRNLKVAVRNLSIALLQMVVVYVCVLWLVHTREHRWNTGTLAVGTSPQSYAFNSKYLCLVFCTCIVVGLMGKSTLCVTAMVYLNEWFSIVNSSAYIDVFRWQYFLRFANDCNTHTKQTYAANNFAAELDNIVNI